MPLLIFLGSLLVSVPGLSGTEAWAQDPTVAVAPDSTAQDAIIDTIRQIALDFGRFVHELDSTNTVANNALGKVAGRLEGAAESVEESAESMSKSASALGDKIGALAVATNRLDAQLGNDNGWMRTIVAAALVGLLGAGMTFLNRLTKIRDAVVGACDALGVRLAETEPVHANPGNGQHGFSPHRRRFDGFPPPDVQAECDEILAGGES